MLVSDRNGFWSEAFAIHGSIRKHVISYVGAFGLIAAVICLFVYFVEWFFGHRIVLEVAPYELAGAALGLLLVLRTNAGYDRWWEARKLWGGIVNQSRNLVISAMSYGPDDPEWREKFVQWVAVFPHVARCSLRGERPSAEVVRLVGREATDRIEMSAHMPSYVSARIAESLRAACIDFQMDGDFFLAMDRERMALIDHIGACERILKTPLPLVYAIEIRRFIALFLMMLPLVLLHRLDGVWMVPLITMIVAYPLMAIDQIGIELQNPFATSNLSHLPLEEICSTIERNVIGMLERKRDLDS